MRLFAALPLDPTVIERLASLRLRLSAPSDGLRWSSPEQWHITLQFYGEITEAQLANLHAQLGQASLRAADLRLETLGHFAGKGILFAAVEATPSLVSLHAAVLEAGERSGLVPASRPFHPHITLARSKGRIGVKTMERLSRPTLPSFGPPLAWKPSRLLLLQSDLLPEGATYTERASVPLVP